VLNDPGGQPCRHVETAVFLQVVIKDVFDAMRFGKARQSSPVDRNAGGHVDNVVAFVVQGYARTSDEQPDFFG